LAARVIAFTNCGKDFRRIAGIHKERGIRHEPLQHYLKAGLSDTVRRLGEDLAGLQGSRTDADYDMAKPVGKEDAVQAIDDAEAFLIALDAANPRDIGKAVETHIGATHKTGGGV
jgi:hypothetical protein